MSKTDNITASVDSGQPVKKRKTVRGKGTERPTDYVRKEKQTRNRLGIEGAEKGGRPRKIDDLEGRSVQMETRIKAEELEMLYRRGRYPRPPLSLSDAEYVIWTDVIYSYQLENINILKICDTRQLVSYCRACARYDQAESTYNALVKRNGGKVVSKNEELNKQIKEIRKAMGTEFGMIMKLSEELCLTPSGRKKYMSGEAEEEEDDGQGFLDSLAMEEE